MTEPKTAFDMLAHHLREVVHALESGKGDSDGRPLPDSPAALENANESFRGGWEQTPAYEANDLGRLLCVAASDHMLSLADTLESTITGAFVSFTIGRGVFWEQCLKPVDRREGAYLPDDHAKVLKHDRRANAGREGTTHAHRSPWSNWW